MEMPMRPENHLRGYAVAATLAVLVLAGISTGGSTPDLTNAAQAAPRSLVVPVQLKSVVQTACTGKHIADAEADPARKARLEECKRKISQDLANNVSNGWYTICLKDGGMSCCKDSGSSGARSCDRIMTSRGGETVGPLNGTVDGGPKQPAGPMGVPATDFSR